MSAEWRVVNRVFVLVLVLLSMPNATFAAEATPPDEAAQFISALGQEAVQVLSDQASTLEQREVNVQRLLARSFALNKIGKFVLGKTWKTATTAQQTEYLQLFARYVVSTYSRRLGGYTGESFEVVKAEPLGKKDAVVFTNISRPSGAPITCGWRVRRAGDDYQILDVMVEGISMVSAQRSEFASVIKAQGLDGLIQSLRIQVTKFAAQAS